MTPSNESQQDSATTDSTAASSSAPAGKTPRRRVTRVAAAPTIKPVTFLTAEPVTTTAATPQAVETAKQAAPAAQPAPRRSRRATTAAGAPKTTGAVETSAAPQESSVAKDQAPVEKKLPVLDLPEPKNAPKKNTRAGRGGKQPLADLDVFAEVAALTGKKVAAPQTSAKAPEAPAAPSAVDLVINLDEVAQEHEAQVAKAGRSRSPQRNAKSARGTDKKAATQTADVPAQETASAASESDSAQEKTVAPEKTTEPRRRGRGRANQVFLDPRASTNDRSPAQTPQKPRLATTALLFQAPDLSAAVVPPAPVAAPIVAEEETVTEAPRTQRTERTERSNQRGRGRDNNRRSRVKDEVVTEEDAPQDSVEQEESVDAAVAAPDQTDSGVSAQDESTAQETSQDESTDSSDNDSDNDSDATPRRRRRRGGRGRGNRHSTDNGDNEESDDSGDTTEAADSEVTASADAEEPNDSDDSDDQDNGDSDEEYSSSRRRRRRRRGTRTGEDEQTGSTRTRSRSTSSDEVTPLKGSTRLEAKRQRRREGRDAGRRRTIITEAEFLARRESVERSMIVRERDGRTQIAVLEDGVLVEHYVSQQQQASMAGNVYLGRVQNVLPSMEAAFIDVGKGRNAVLYAGEVNWDAAGLDGQPRRIEEALKSGDQVLVQVTKDPIGHKGARLTSQVTLAGRYLVYVPGGGMTGISRKLPDTERARLKRILKEIVPEGAGVIVRTAAEGASEEELKSDVERLQTQWQNIEKKAKTASAPSLLQGEPDLAIRVVRDIFNDDFTSLQVQGNNAWTEISSYVQELAPDLADRVTHWVSEKDIFAQARVDEQLAKGMDRKVWLPSGGSLVIDRTEAMTVIDVNTGKFTGAGGTLEETVTRNNLESAEEIVRQLRLRDIGGIIVIDFIDMVLESNRDLVLRRLVECLGRDRTKHQVAEVTSLGLVQMTRKRVGQGLVEAFSTTCEHCNGRGFIVHEEPNERQGAQGAQNAPAQDHNESKRSKRKRNQKESATSATDSDAVAHLDGDTQSREAVKATLATIAAAAVSSHEGGSSEQDSGEADNSKSPKADSAQKSPVVPEPAQAASGQAASEPAANSSVPEEVVTGVVKTGVVQRRDTSAEVASESVHAETLFDAPEASESADSAPAKPARKGRSRRATGGGKANAKVDGSEGKDPVGIMVIPAATTEAAVTTPVVAVTESADEAQTGAATKAEPKTKQAAKAKSGAKAATGTKAQSGIKAAPKAKTEPKAKASTKSEPKVKAAAKADAAVKAKAEPKAKTTRTKSAAKTKAPKESVLSDVVADAAATAAAAPTTGISSESGAKGATEGNAIG